MNDLISIIVPVYNVEIYLDKCIQSLVEQTYTNLEIILVDDGSPDNCPAMCDAWAKKDRRIQVIHQKNGGLSAARNAGFKVSRGKYVVFIDSDDYTNIYMMEHLLEIVTKTGADVAICQYRSVAEEDIHDIYIKPDGTYFITDGDSLYRALLNNLQNVGGAVWNKLWSRELFIQNNITYPDGRVYEDICVVNKLLHYSAKVVVSECEMYYNRIRSGSIINSPLTMRKCKDNIMALKEIVDDYYSWGVMDIAEKTFSQFCRASIVLYYNTYRILDDTNRKQAREYIKEQYHSCWHNYRRKLRLSLVKRIIFHLFLYFPEITAYVLSKLLLKQRSKNI